MQWVCVGSLLANDVFVGVWMAFRNCMCVAVFICIIKLTRHRSHLMDVSGSVNATSIATGGSTAKQFDCGTLTPGSSGTNVSYNFIFTNIPSVVCCSNNAGGGVILETYFAYNITKTGFTCKGSYYNGSMGVAGSPITWIAVG